MQLKMKGATGGKTAVRLVERRGKEEGEVSGKMFEKEGYCEREV